MSPVLALPDAIGATGTPRPESKFLAVHTAALRAAGFTEIGTLWQRGSNRLLAAVR